MEMVSDELIGKIQHGENVSEQEWTQILDWLCLYQFAQEDNVNFWYVSHYLCEDALKILSDNPGRWMPLEEIYDCFAPASRLPFLLHCFRLRGCLSVSELTSLWYKCFEDDELLNWTCWEHGGGNGQRIQTDRMTCLVYPPQAPREDLMNSVLTDLLLIDNSIVIRRYCQCRKSGWEYLQTIKGKRWGRPSLDESFKAALSEHDTANFCIRWDMNGRKRTTVPLLIEIIRHGADGIFRQMLMRFPYDGCSRKFDELCMHIVVNSPEPVATRLLQAMEAVHPGLLRQIHDCWGRNLLWYAMHNRNAAWFDPRCKITPFLLEAGCDPNNRNQLGLRWQDVNDWPSPLKKTRMIQDRWGTSYCFL